MTARESFHDSMGGGAWPFLVGGLICLVYSDNERDLRTEFFDASVDKEC